MKVDTSLILAGGFGTRLKSVINDIPKPMALIGELPFLDYLISKLKKHNIKNITLLTHYESEMIESYYNKNPVNNVTIDFSPEESPLGTGGAMKLAIKNIDKQEYFLCLNGDSFFNIDLSKFINESFNILNSNSNVQCIIALKKHNQSSRYGGVETTDNGQVAAFLEKKDSSSNWINAGIYLVKKEIINEIPDGKISLETEVFPKLIKSEALYAIKKEGEFIDIGVPEDYKHSQELLPKWNNCNNLR